ncbi:MAG: hypothetical protein FWD83_04315 [Promicromonosporaceae bacterium]|nr:hypothetical protein [Promicromonosporaceae bacterium]
MKRQAVTLLAAVVVVASMAGCGGDSAAIENAGAEQSAACEADDNPFACEFERLYAETDSEFVRSILRDGVITLAEKQEAITRFNECFAAGGIDGYIDPAHGGWHWSTSEGDDIAAMEEIVRYCEQQWGGEVVMLYTQMRDNPENLTYWDRVAGCLMRHELVPPGGITGPELEALSAEYAIPTELELARQHPSILSIEVDPHTGDWLIEHNPDWVEPDLVLPNGVNMSEGQAWQCLFAPDS